MSSPRLRTALLALLLAAFALRLWGIEAQGIWGDEAFSIFTAKQDIAVVVSGGADTHPPLYHFLLHYWMEATGRTPFALRALSVGWSMLCVAAAYALARTAVRDGRAAIAGAALVALSPFQVFYAQETRMYAQAAALCALSLALFVRWLRAPTLGALMLWAPATLLALYTHYFAFFVLAAQDMYLLASWWRGRDGLRAVPDQATRGDPVPGANSAHGTAAGFALFAGRYGTQVAPYQTGGSRVGAVAVAHAVMALAYLPWVNAQREYLSRQANARAATLSLEGAADVVGRSLSALYAGTTTDGWLQAGAALFCMALALAGWRADAREKGGNAGLLLLAVLVPIAGAIAVNPLLPFFRERFLLIGSAPFAVLMAAGVGRLPRPARAGAVVALAGIALLALANYWHDPRYRKGEYDQAIATIRAGAAPGDAVVRYAPIQDALWDYYRIEGMPEYVLPGADLAAVAAKHQRAWLLLYGDPAVFDPRHDAEAFFGANGFKAFYQGYRDGALARYDFPTAGAPLVTARVRFGDAIVLEGYAVPEAVGRGATLPVTLAWRTSALLAEDYTVFAHLLDAGGVPVAQMDTQPVGGARPTRTWALGETIRDPIGIAIPANVAPGRYRVAVGMYLLRTLERLPVRDAGTLPAQDNALVVGEVEVR